MYLCCFYDTIVLEGVIGLSPQVEIKRRTAVMVSDTLNKIEGVPVTEFAKELSSKWAKGEITGVQMKTMLIQKHKRISQ